MNKTLKIFLIWKAITVAAFIITFMIGPFNVQLWTANAFGPFAQIPSLYSAFAAWDGLHYIKLADSFYTQRDLSTAFYPLFPFLMILTNKLGLTSFASGLFWSFFLSFVALVYFEKIATALLEPKEAHRALLLFLTFPTAFYLTAIYAEGLFLALVLSMTYYLLVRRSYWALIPAILLPLSRGQGLLMGFVCLAYLIWSYVTPPRQSRKLTLAVTLAILFGQGLYFLFMWWKYGDPLIGFETQKNYVFQYTIANLFRPWRLLENLFATPWYWFGYSKSGIDRLFLIYALIFSIPVFKSKQPFMIFSYLVLTGVPALMGNLSIFCRMALSIFPIFFYAPSALKTLSDRAFKVWVILSALLQIFLIGRFVNFHWVA